MEDSPGHRDGHRSRASVSPSRLGVQDHTSGPQGLERPPRRSHGPQDIGLRDRKDLRGGSDAGQDQEDHRHIVSSSPITLSKNQIYIFFFDVIISKSEGSTESLVFDSTVSGSGGHWTAGTCLRNMRSTGSSRWSRMSSVLGFFCWRSSAESGTAVCTSLSHMRVFCQR